MKRVFKFIGQVYRLVWENTIKRPFTYSWRELTKKSWKARLLATAIYLSVMVPPLLIVDSWWLELWVIVGYSVAFLAGHLWWDTGGAYIKYQSDFKEDQ